MQSMYMHYSSPFPRVGHSGPEVLARLLLFVTKRTMPSTVMKKTTFLLLSTVCTTFSPPPPPPHLSWPA